MDLLSCLRAPSTAGLVYTAVGTGNQIINPEVGNISEPANTGSTSGTSAPTTTAPNTELGPMPAPPRFERGGRSGSVEQGRRKRSRSAPQDAAANLQAFQNEPSRGGFFINSANMTNTSPQLQWEILKSCFSTGLAGEEEEVEGGGLEQRSRLRTPARGAPQSGSGAPHEVEEIEDTPPHSPPAQQNQPQDPQAPTAIFTVGPRFEAGEVINPKVLKVLSVSKQDHELQLDYLETTAAPPLQEELDKLSEKQYDRSSVQLAYYTHNMIVQGLYRRAQLQEDLAKQKQLTSDMAADLNRVKEQLVKEAEEKRLANDALKTAEARIGKLQFDLAASKKEMAAAKAEQEKELQGRRKAESDYEKLRTSLPAITTKVLASADVQEPFIRLVVAAQDCGASELHKALVAEKVVLPDPLPEKAATLLKQDCEDRFAQAGEDLKVLKARFTEEIGGPIPVPVEQILGKLQ